MSTRKGFTLIELLLVITIISILAMVILSGIDMDLLIKRARDGVTKAAITKVAFAVEAFESATGRIPSNEGCTCENQERCELLYELAEGNVTCHKTQIVPEGTKLWIEIRGIKVGEDLLGTLIDLDDSDAIRYHDWDNGCVAGVSEAHPPWVFVWHNDFGFLSCLPPSEIHPGLFTCNNLRNSRFRMLNCSGY